MVTTPTHCSMCPVPVPFKPYARARALSSKLKHAHAPCAHAADHPTFVTAATLGPGERSGGHGQRHSRRASRTAAAAPLRTAATPPAAGASAMRCLAPHAPSQQREWLRF